MKQYIILSLLLLSCFLLKAADLDNLMEAGKATIKIRSAAKQQLNISAMQTGISSLDSKLQALKISRVQNRFRHNASLAKSGLPDLSLILELTFDPKLDPLAVCNLLMRDTHVEYAEPIYIDTAFAVPNDANYPASLYFAALQAEEAWEIHKGEDGAVPIIIAVVDTGVNWKHPDLAENIHHNLGEDANGNGYTIYHNGSAWVYDPGDLNGLDDDGNGFADDLIGWDFMLDAQGNQNFDPWESSGHGTAVSGIADARTNNSIGVSSLAWNLGLMPISCSLPGSSSIYRGYEGIIYAAENGADVINCSWGGTSRSLANQDAVNYAFGLGAIIVAAAGNSNNSIPIYPAAYQNVVAVAAVQNDGQKSNVSNFGAYIDVAAPNTAVGTTSGNSYALVNGATSYASPIGSSLAALIKSYHPTWTNEEVINQLIATCDNIDAFNIGKENMLGQGKLNAFRALSEINPSVDDELRLALFEQRSPTDQNGNRAIEAGEQFYPNLTIRNYSFGVSSNNVNYTLSSTDPMVSILQNFHSGSIAADGFAYLDDVFLVQVSPTATSKYVTFTLSITADKAIVAGSTITFQVLINAGGIYVWEGVASGRNMSGNYIRTRLSGMGYQVTYGTTFPASFYTFDAVFLSFGMVGSNIRRFDNETMYFAVKEYLQSGGKLYIEGCDVVGYDMATYLPDVEGGLDAHEVLWQLLGVQDADDGITNPINALSASEGWITYPLLFSASNQTKNDYIDRFVPMQNAYPAFVESDYGIVALEHMGNEGQRTFIFSYPLAELVDAAFPHTKAELVNRIISFFLAPAPLEPEIRTITGNAEQILPQFMQGDSVAGENNQRVPFAFRVKLENLSPNSTYRYINKAVKSSDSPLFQGEGNPLYVSMVDSFIRSENANFGSLGSYGELISDGNGDYEGWFILEATGAEHFSPGTELFIRISLNDGNGGEIPRIFYSSQSSVKALAFGTEEDSSQGTAIIGASNAEDKNFVFLYDNQVGLGRPISGTHIEVCGVDFELPEYPVFYKNLVFGNSGAWGSIIPNSIDSKGFGGILRIEARALNNGTIVAVSTDDDGIWQSGADTSNPSGGLSDPVFIQEADATLPVVLSSFTAIPEAEGWVKLNWITESETNLTGFYLLRNRLQNLGSALRISPLINALNSSTPTAYHYHDTEIESGGYYYYWLQSVDYDGSIAFSTPVSVYLNTEDVDDIPELPMRTELKSIFPNPFNPSTNITYAISETSTVQIDIYNARGQKVKTLVQQTQAPAYYQISWQGDDEHGKRCASGIYLIKLKVGELSFGRKIVLAK